MTGKWLEAGVPQKGWESVEVRDLGPERMIRGLAC